MRAIADTNTVISGLLWLGAPRRVLDAARAGALQLFTSAALLAELEEVLQRPYFKRRLDRKSVDVLTYVIDYAALTTLVQPTSIARVIEADPADDAVIACAVAANAEAIVSGDHHLLDIKEYRGIRILTAPALLELLAKST